MVVYGTEGDFITITKCRGKPPFKPIPGFPCSVKFMLGPLCIGGMIGLVDERYTAEKNQYVLTMWFSHNIWDEVWN